MYHPDLVAAAQASLEDGYRTALPDGLVRHTVADADYMTRRLASAVDEGGALVRDLSAEEQAFILNERLLTKIDYHYTAERYHQINAGAQGIRRLYPLWESQELILAALGDLEKRRVDQRHPDGLLVNCLKARQLGASSLTQSLLAHRVTTQTFIRGLIASDVPENSGSSGLFGMLELTIARLPWWLRPVETFHTKNHHIVFATGSSVIVESGKSMKGGLTEEGGQKGNIGRSKTYSVAHLSELSTWERAEQIDDGLLPAIPMSPRTLLVCESTAKGRHNWWHQQWLTTARGRGRFANVFIPWYAEATKYWLPAPVDWSPTTTTLEHARLAEQHGPQWLRRSVQLTRNQLYWYESTRAAMEEKGLLAKFLEEFAADPEECFQHSGRSIFPHPVIERLRARALGTLKDLWVIEPAKDLAAIKAFEQSSRS